MKNKYRVCIFILAAVLIFAGCAQKSGASQAAVPSKTAKFTVSDKKKSAGANALNDYVEIKETKTVFGVIQIPQISESLLNSEDVKQANRMFKDIESSFLNTVEEYKKKAEEYNEPLTDSSDRFLCKTKIALNDGIISILLECEYLEDYNAPIMKYFDGVNIDIKTAKAVPSADIIKKAGFTEQAVKDTIYAYGDRCMFSSWEKFTYFNFANQKTLPDGLGDPSPEWIPDVENYSKNYKNIPEFIKSSWDFAGRFPTVFYEGQKNLSVCGKVPTIAGAGYAYAMIKVGDTSEEAFYKNTKNCFGIDFGRGAMLMEGARIAVARELGLNSAWMTKDGTKLNVEPASMDILNAGKENQETVYIINVYEDSEANTAAQNQWAVGTFTGRVWQKDAAKDDWILKRKDAEEIGKSIMKDKKSQKAVAAVLNRPDEYETWLENIYPMFDMSTDKSSPDFNEGVIQNLFLYAMLDGTTVSFDAGEMENGRFKPSSTFHLMKLDKGQAVNIWFNRPNKAAPSQAITIKNKNGKYIYIINSSNDKEKIEYLSVK